MKFSNKSFIQLYKQLPEFRAKPYLDSDGNKLIGYGHKITPGDGVASNDTINKFKALSLLLDDLENISDFVNKSVPSITNQNEFDAVVMSIYTESVETKAGEV